LKPSISLLLPLAGFMYTGIPDWFSQMSFNIT
ncbi:MAG: hypothetical protein ACJAV1_003572, partial [Paraglaciecola sp.]